MSQGSHGYYRAVPPQVPGPANRAPEAQAILERLDLIERKIDWIARRVSVAEAHRPEPSGHSPKETVDKAAAMASPAAASATGPQTDARHTAPVQASSPATGEDEPAAASAPPTVTSWTPAGPQPQDLKAAYRPGTPYGFISPSASTSPHPREASQVLTAAPPAALPPTGPTWWERAHREGNVGRYLLSGAAALVTVLAGVTLLALVWSVIPDAVKIGTVAVVAVALIAAGTRMTLTRPRQRVAAATLCGTGGALGYVSIIGGVLLDGLIPAYPAFVLMALWGLALLFLSRHTAQVFTAVISTIGALITIGFAVEHVRANPGVAMIVWGLVLAYLLTLAGTTAVMARTSGELRWAVWYPTTSMVATAMASLAAPMAPLVEASPWVGPLLVLASPTLLGVQVLQSGPCMVRRGWTSLVGWDWAVRVGTTLLTVVLLHAVMDRPIAPFILALLAIETVFILVATLAPLETRWASSMTGWLLGGAVATALLASGIAHQAVTFACALVAVTACLTVRLGLVWAISCASASSLLSIMALRTDVPYVPALALAGTVLLLAAALLSEVLLAAQALPEGPDGPRPPAPAPDQVAGRSASIEAAGVLRVSMWVSACVMILLVPAEIAAIPVIPLDLGTEVYFATATAIGCVLALMGLFSPRATMLSFLRGEHVLERPGTDDDGAPLSDDPPNRALVASIALAGAALINQVIASTHDLALATVLVAVALASSMVGGRFVVPWLRRPVVGAGLGLFYTILAWSSLCILSGTRAYSVPVSVLLLVCGAVCILVGFGQRATALRHYGLVLVLLSVFKLATVDISTSIAITRILALLAAGAVCFGLSLAYNRLVVGTAEQDGTQTGTGADLTGQYLSDGPPTQPGDPSQAAYGLPPQAPPARLPDTTSTVPGPASPSADPDSRWKRPGT